MSEQNSPAMVDAAHRPDGLPGGERGLRAPPLPAMDEAGLPWNEWDGVMILDASGCITFCSSTAADLLNGTPAQMVGQQVTALIPELPFGRYTPAFNLAYVLFHGNDGVWARRSLLTRDGNRVPLDVSLGSVSEVGDHSIVLIFKQSAPCAGAGLDRGRTPASRCRKDVALTGL